MKVILITDVKKVGKRGELVTVADGYGMNVLIAGKKAVLATAENIKKYEQGLKDQAVRNEHAQSQARSVVARLSALSVTVVAKSSENGTLFKSIHAADIADEIKKTHGIALPAESLKLDHPIKQKGTYSVPVLLLGVKGSVSVLV